MIDPFAAADARLRALLAGTRTIAVVGLSPDLQRPSHGVASYLQAHGFRIVPVNPNAVEVLGEKAFPTLAEAARHARIDLVDVFRRREDVPPLMQQAIEIGVPAVWLQLGICHDEAKAQGEAAGVMVVQNRCLMIEHRRLN